MNKQTILFLFTLVSWLAVVFIGCTSWKNLADDKSRRNFSTRGDSISLTSRLCFRRYFTLLSIIYTRRIGALVQIHMFLFIIVLGLQHVSIFRETLFRFFSFFRRPTYSVPYILDFFILYRAYRPNFVSTFFFLLSRPSDWKKNLQKNSCS